MLNNEKNPEDVRVRLLKKLYDDLRSEFDVLKKPPKPVVLNVLELK